MIARPLLMSGSMVRATIREKDPKRQTRRVMKPQPGITALGREIRAAWAGAIDRESSRTQWHTDFRAGQFVWGRSPQRNDPNNFFREHFIRCPYGVTGDRLYVRETWDADFYWPEEGGGIRRSWEETPISFRGVKADPFVSYRADHTTWGFDDTGRMHDSPVGFDESDDFHWKPSIHMPRWASRLTLEITEIRVERVQDISESDAIAEGITEKAIFSTAVPVRAGPLMSAPCFRAGYAILWDSLNAKRGYGWHVNPWVWVIEFQRVTPE